MKSNQYFSLPIALSVLMHTALLIFITGNWASAKPEETIYRPHYVNATLVELTPKAIAAPQQPKPQVLEAQKKRDEQQRRQQQERERQQAEAKKQREQKAQADKARAEQERLNKVKAEQARKANEDKQRKAEAERKRQEQQQEAQKRIDAALQKEEQFLSDSSDSVTVQTYEALIRRRVEEVWSRPPSAVTGMTTLLEISMVPTGQVVNVRVIRGSGDIAFDRSAEQAVKRVDRFSEIKDMPNDVFERNFRVFNLLFDPEDLRR